MSPTIDDNSMYVQSGMHNRGRKREWRVGKQLSHSQGNDWSASPTNLLFHGCKPGTISTTVWEDLIG